MIWLLNWTAVNTDVQVSLLYSDLDSFECMPKTGIAGSHGSPIISFLRNFQTIFHSGGCANKDFFFLKHVFLKIILQEEIRIPGPCFSPISVTSDLCLCNR
jgi:hypothetical protein